MIRVGDSVTRVREQCGEPSSIESETRAFPNGGRLDDRCFFGTVTVQMWHYDRRSGGLPTTLFVVDGKVERIQLETGGYRAGWTSSCR